LVTVAEYRQVLGRTVRLTPGEGASSCNVKIGGNPMTAIIPNLNPCNAAYIKRALAAIANKQRVPSLGPLGYVWIDPIHGSVSTYAEKDSWSVGFQTGMVPKAMTKAQAIKLTAIALKRV
jgi:hypothetical protein